MNLLSKMTATALSVCSALTAGAQLPLEPDFAFPQQVIAAADPVLRDGSGLARMQALMQIICANSAIDPDSVFTAPAKVEALIATEKSPDIRGLLMLYEARLLSGIYQSNSYKYNQVDAPLTPRPESIAEWSGAQFRAAVSELISAGMEQIQLQARRPLREYLQVINASDASMRYYPTLGDFAYASARTSLQGCNDNGMAATIAGQAYESAGEHSLFRAVAACWLPDTAAKLYSEYPKGEYGAYLLLALNNSVERYKYVDMLREYLSDNSRNALTEAVEQQLQSLTNPAMRFDVPHTAAPGVEFTGLITHDYTGSTGFNIYRVSNPEVIDVSKRNLVRTAQIQLDTDSLRGNVTDTVRLTLDRAGIYIIKPVINGKENKQKWQSAEICVTPFVPVLTTNGSAGTLILTDYATGNPAVGVKAWIRDSRGTSARRQAGVTNDDGLTEFTLPSAGRNNSNRFVLSLTDNGTDYYYPSGLDIYSYTRHVGNENYTGSVMVDRPLYHPGDSVAWSVVAIRNIPSQKRSEPLANAPLKVIFRNANYQPVDTAVVTTDRYGRASGRFATAADMLTGNYSIQIESGDRYIASQSVMVSDFKAPVFELTDLAVADGVISGRAVTYTGMAVAEAGVSVDFSRYEWWGWRRGTGETIASATGTTDAEGHFAIAVPQEVLSADCDIQCTARVTSAAGEYADARTVFAAGKPLHLVYDARTDRFDTSSPVVLPVRVLNSDGKSANARVRWTLSAAGLPELSGTADVDSAGITINAANAAAGRYSLSVMPVDTARCDSLHAIADIYLYNLADNAVPAGAQVFVPVSDITVRPDETATLTVGVCDDTYIYALCPLSDDRCRVMPLHLSAGFHKVDIPAIADVDERTITLIAVRNGAVITENVNITVDRGEKLTLTAASWRDRLVPGSREEWTFTLSRADGQPVSGAMTATMYNHALDALGTLNWPSALSRWVNSLRADISALPAGLASYYYSPARRGAISATIPSTPGFRYITEYSIRIRGLRAYNSMAKSAATGAVPEPEAATDGVLMEMETVATADYGAAENAGLTQAETESNTLRDGQTLQAFWMPDLSIGTDGNVTIRFHVPESNATWAFRAFAWDETLHSASAMRDIVANRPLMVEPSLPRFLREGDSATLLATIYNNSGETDTVTAVIEIFDPVSGAIRDTRTSTEVILDGSSAIVSMPVKADVGSTVAGYRIRVRSPRYSDGEQDAIPVLPSGTTVVESDNFVLTAERPEFETVLPSDSTSIVALQYCQNPVWDVVRSLPDLLRTDKNMSSIEAARGAYGALTADGLLVKYPEIKQVIDLWQASPADSALVSDLMKNEDIKIALLGQTPWMTAAASETERMGRLAVTFDRRNISSTLDRAVSTLRKLQLADGGFAWGSWCDNSSLWATTAVLTTVGRLNPQLMAASDSRLRTIVDKALRYCDEHVRDNDFGYVTMLTMYPDYCPTTLNARTAVEKTVQYIIANWRNAPTALKARYALILDANGHKALAIEIMKSIREFGVETPDGALTFPSVTNVDSYTTLLEAFTRIAPEKSDIDQMRRWLMLRTRVSDDMGAYDPAALVSAILATGTAWTTLDTQTAAVSVGGIALRPDAVEVASGEFSTRLSAAHAGKRLTVTRGDNSHVSYGSLTTVAKRQMTEVAARACESLSVEKRLMVQRDGQWVVTDRVRLGERVRVQLLINATEDLEYVTVNDERAAALEPVDQLPGYVYASSLGFYRENSDSRTRLFVNRMPRGTYYLTYDMTASVAGHFASGIATVQSQYAPEVTAHSGGTILTVE